MSATRPAGIDYVHHVPGRLRVRIPELKQNQLAAGQLARTIRSTRGVLAADINPLTGSVLIRYDRTQTCNQSLLRLFQYSDTLGTQTYRATTQSTQAGSNRARSAKTCTCGAMVRRHGNDLAAKIGSKVLEKTLELAIERSIVLLLAALL